ncbi:hypothetical protein ACIB24_03880 [Spongisporangium articulatum]|uniref:PASTA domain-containing protein n=1 Tax=Spongisporangium articulatum TaxID=3362603 RepID=A0ABW8AIK1_9ACTN
MGFLVFTVVLVVAVLVLVLTLVAAAQGPEKKNPTAAMPSVLNKGLEYAVEQTHAEYSRDVDSIDATGRDRRIGDKRNWVVCFQQPDAGTQTPGQNVRLYGVRTDETCNSLDKNYGYLPPVYDPPGGRGTHEVPDLTNFTPFMARQAFGDVASIVNTDPSASPSPEPVGARNRVVRVIDRAGLAIFGDWGDYRICSQSPAPGVVWTGQVVRLTVVPYDDKC